MPDGTGQFADIVLQPGVNTQLTRAANTAGVSVSELIRYKLGQVQKLGGWSPFYPFPLSTTPVRDLHVFQSLRLEQFVAFGSPTTLGVIQGGVVTNLTPQAFISSIAALSFSITSGSSIVSVHDPGSSMSVFGAILFNTPVALGLSSQGGILLNGAYPVTTVIDSSNYQINVTAALSTTISSGGVLPSFYTASGSGQIGVILPNNGFQTTLGLLYPFIAPTSVGGITIQGPYQVTSIVDSTNFFIGAPTPATTTVSSASAVTMNGGLVQIYHYVTQGPPPAAAVYGSGLYGAGPYGIGTVPAQGSAPPIVAQDWTLDNWGQNLIACAQNGAIYAWAPDVSLTQASAIVQGGAPVFNIGAFVAMPQQVIVAFGCSQVITGTQDPLLVRFSDTGAQQGYMQWTAATNNAAGSFKIPTGGALRAGIQVPGGYAAVFTDIDVWTMQYIGQPIIWSFQKVGTGCGALGLHVVGVLGGICYWAATNNFFMLSGGSVSVLPCPVWDFFFQQLDTVNSFKVQIAVNSTFNEISWFFPVIGGTGENSAYVKMHINEGFEYEWDFGFLSRSAWCDVSLLGTPLGVDNNNILQQHEISNDAAGTVLNGAFETGYFLIGDGTNLAIVDWVLPDMKWGQFGTTTSATIQFTFFTTDYPGALERVYGPFGVTQSVPFINCRMRGRYWRCRIENLDLGSFWRVGRIKFRWHPTGRR